MSVNLRIPGPTPCPDDVLQAMSRQMINHRGPEFAEIMGRITAGLQTMFETKNDVLTLTSAGTGALEAAVVNTLSPGDHALCVSIGVFGDRFADIGTTYGVERREALVRAGHRRRPGADRRGAEEGSVLQGRHGHAQRDVDRRHERPRRHRQGDPRRPPGHPHPRRRDQQPRLSAAAHRRLGPRRRLHGLAEGLDGAARHGDGRRQQARLGRRRDGEDPALLLRLQEGEEATSRPARRRGRPPSPSTSPWTSR